MLLLIDSFIVRYMNNYFDIYIIYIYNILFIMQISTIGVIAILTTTLTIVLPSVFIATATLKWFRFYDCSILICMEMLPSVG